MFLSKRLCLNQPYSCVLDAIKKQTRTYFSKGSLHAGRFTVYKSVAYNNSRNIFRFRFSGEIRQTNEQVEIVYQVHPNIAVYIAAVILGLPLIKGTVNLIGGMDSVWFTTIGFVINCLFYGLVLSQRKSCIKAFESSFCEGENVNTGDGSVS